MMTTEPSLPPLDEIPQAVVVRRRRWLPSLVWLVPVLAAIIGLSLAVRAVMNQGPTITLSLSNADGLESGKTHVRYRDIDIGVVQVLRLSPDRKRVLATIDLDKQAEDFAVEGSRFWVVRPRVGAGGISGLNTLLSGVYIGVDGGHSHQPQKEFVALDTPPVVTADVPGRSFMLHADELGSLDVGSPIYYRRVSVGQVSSYKLDDDGQGVTLRVFVNAPYDHFVTADSRFWQASGLDVQFDASGVKVSTPTLAALLAGGITFQEPPESTDDTPAPENTRYTLFGSQTAAMRPLNDQALSVVVYFPQSLRGLSVGAPVDFRGLVVGEVKSIQAQYDNKLKRFQLPVTLQLDVERLKDMGPGRPAEHLAELVRHGLRAQLRTASMLTGQLYVAFDFFKQPVSGELAMGPHGNLILPTQPGSFDELQAALGDIVSKVRKVPFDEIGRNSNESLKNLTVTLDNMNKLLVRIDNELAPEAKATLEQTRKTMAAATETLSSDSPTQQGVRDAINQLSQATRSLRVLTDYLQQHPEALLRGKPEDSQ